MDPFKTTRPNRPLAADAPLIALQAIAYLGADEDLLMQFLGQTGSDADDLRDRIGEPAFLGAVLDFVLSDDATVVAFAASLGMPPETLLQARQHLP